MQPSPRVRNPLIQGAAKGVHESRPKYQCRVAAQHYSAYRMGYTTVVQSWLSHTWLAPHTHSSSFGTAGVRTTMPVKSRPCSTVQDEVEVRVRTGVGKE